MRLNPCIGASLAHSRLRLYFCATQQSHADELCTEAAKEIYLESACDTPVAPGVCGCVKHTGFFFEAHGKQKKIPLRQDDDLCVALLLLPLSFSLSHVEHTDNR